MVISLIALVVGFVLDLCIGDPHWVPHPICFIGNFIGWQEKRLRNIFPPSKCGETIAGAILAILTIFVATGLPLLILKLSQQISPYLRLLIESIMCWQLLATKCLKVESTKVYDALVSNDISQARYNLSMIVGRDTSKLDAVGITKAAIETVAENTTDGVVSPMLFCAFCGASGGFLYKAINTMDSMIGYKNERYLYFGRVAARLDDVANYLPSRITAILMIFSAAILRFDAKGAFSIWRRDRRKHASPNSAQTESVCAGALGIQLAGDAVYQGVLHKKEYIGDHLKAVSPRHIRSANQLLYVTAILSLVAIVSIKTLVIIFL